jgi:hypothetical protein
MPRTKAHALGARGKERNVARELQAVAEALLSLHVDVLAGQTFALPRLLRKARSLALAGAQPPFVFVPAFAEIAAHQQQDAEPGMGVGLVGRKCQGVAQHHHAFLEPAAVVQRGAEIGPGVGKFRLQRDGTAISGDGFVEAPQAVQGIAEIAVRLGEVRTGGDRLPLRRGGRVVVFQLVQRHAEIAQRPGHLRVDLERAPRFLGSELGAARQPQHLAEIGVVEGAVRRQADRALHMLDGFAKPAVLMGDDAKQVLGLRHLGLRLQDAPADRLGFHQAAFGAAAIGVRQRFADRHKGRWRSALVGGRAHGLPDIMAAMAQPSRRCR